MNPWRDMKGRFRRKWLICALAVAGVFVFSLTPRQAWATSTGLNNIPTADTPPHRTVVIQVFANAGDERDEDYLLGFKTGLEFEGHRLEWGLDGRLGEGEGGPPVFQAKYAVQPWEDLPTFAIGAANIAVTSKDRDEVGEAFKFGVITHEFEWFRVHAGYGFQHENDAAFFGLDKTIELLGRDLMLRTDFIQIDDQDQWLASAGFIYFLDKHVALESWVSQPFDHGEPVFTIKLNLIFEF